MRISTNPLFFKKMVLPNLCCPQIAPKKQIYPSYPLVFPTIYEKNSKAYALALFKSMVFS